MQEIRRRGLKVAVVGIPKTIDNDIPVRMPCCICENPILLSHCSEKMSKKVCV